MPADSASPSMATIENEYYAYLLGEFPTADTPLSATETDILNSINTLLSSSKDTCESLPRLPEVLPKLLLALRDQRASWESISDIIAQDAVLVAGVLHLANSPVFRAAAKVSNLEQVVMQLGMVGLREVVVTVSLKPIMKFDGGGNAHHLGRNIWTQAQSAAVACRSLAKTQPNYRFEAYLAGLVHNTGMVVVAHTLRKHLQTPSHGTLIPCSLLFCEQIQDAVKRLSLMVAEYWGLPDVTLAALEEQMTPGAEFASPLGGILQRGIQLSRLHELQHAGIIDDTEARLKSLSEDEYPASQQAFEQISRQNPA